METIEVTASFDSQGQITPLSFKWRGRTFRIESTGRFWEAKDGFHILVMVPGDRVFHLIFGCETKTWKLVLNSDKPTNSRI